MKNLIYLEDRIKIRKSYENWFPRSDPYKYFPWFQRFTPIEKNVWRDIRYLGLPFYPQFPIGKYFVDFADPLMKIVIEVDGKEFHKDHEKDLARQREIESKGWEVIRIPGWKTFKSSEDYIERTEEFYENCSEGILEDLLRNTYL